MVSFTDIKTKSFDHPKTGCNFPAKTPGYFHREYTNDIKTEEASFWSQQAKRAALVALPFFSLYKPLNQPLSVILSSVRAVSSIQTLSSLLAEIKNSTSSEQAAELWKQVPLQILKLSIETIAVAGSIFAHPIGMLITTCQDLISEIFVLIHQLAESDMKAACISSAHLLNNTLYLALFLSGSLQILIASLAFQATIGLYHSISEFQKGNHLEGIGHLAMSMIRGHECTQRISLLKTYANRTRMQSCAPVQAKEPINQANGPNYPFYQLLDNGNGSKYVYYGYAGYLGNWERKIPFNEALQIALKDPEITHFAYCDGGEAKMVYFEMFNELSKKHVGPWSSCQIVNMYKEQNMPLGDALFFREGNYIED